MCWPVQDEEQTAATAVNIICLPSEWGPAQMWRPFVTPVWTILQPAEPLNHILNVTHPIFCLQLIWHRQRQDDESIAVGPFLEVITLRKCTKIILESSECISETSSRPDSRNHPFYRMSRDLRRDVLISWITCIWQGDRWWWITSLIITTTCLHPNCSCSFIRTNM